MRDYIRICERARHPTAADDARKTGPERDRLV